MGDGRWDERRTTWDEWVGAEGCLEVNVLFWGCVGESTWSHSFGKEGGLETTPVVLAVARNDSYSIQVCSAAPCVMFLIFDVSTA